MLFMGAASLLVYAAADCIDKKNCYDCVNKLTWNPFAHCRWCLLDRKCHTYGAVLTNPCTTYEDIKYDSSCPATHDVYGSYDKDLAYEQTLLSAVSYSDEPSDCMDDIKSSGGGSGFDFEFVRLVAKKCDSFLLRYQKCVAVVALSHSRKSILVSFRGTAEVTQFLHQLKIFVEFKTRLGDGAVQTYFYDVFQKLEKCLTTEIAELKQRYPDYMVRFSGHSLGGALASIAAFTYVRNGILPKSQVSLYTYGMPRVGNKDFAVDHDKRLNNSFKVVNYKDCVTHFPTCSGSCILEGGTGPYHHRTEIFYDTSSMQRDSNYEVCHSDEDAKCSHKYQGPVDTMINSLKCYYCHTNYFGIKIGDHCENLRKVRGKRSASNSIDHLLSSDRCTALHMKDGHWVIKSTESPAMTAATNTAAATDAIMTCIILLAVLVYHNYM